MSEKKNEPTRQPPVKPLATKPVEPKDVKFRRLANHRVNMAVKRIGHVANLANKNSYIFTDEEAATIVRYIQNATDDLVAAFNGSVKHKTLFSI